MFKKNIKVKQLTIFDKYFFLIEDQPKMMSSLSLKNNSLTYLKNFKEGSKDGGRRDTTGEPPYPHDLIHVLIKTKDRIIEVCAPLYEKGFSLREVEEQTGISKFTILGTLSKHGTPIRNYVTGKNVPKDWTKTKHSGHPPFGWTYLDGNLVMDPKEHLIARRILRLHQSGKSNQSIADILNAKKIPTRKGGQWSRSVVRTIIIRENKLNP